MNESIPHPKLPDTPSRTVGVTEEVSPASLVEEALQLEAATFDRHLVEVVRDFAELPLLEVEKHKALQILVHLTRMSDPPIPVVARPANSGGPGQGATFTFHLPCAPPTPS